ncbi:MAG: helix-turn-helix domain-containing protein [Afipia sp.]
MKDYSESPAKGEERTRLLVDSETGEVFQVVEIINKGKSSEALVVASLEMIETSSPQNSGVIGKRRAAKPKYVRLHPEAIAMMKKDPLSPNEQKVLMFFLEHMGYLNRVHVTQRVIAESIGIAKETVSRAIKTLRERGAIYERQDKLIPGLPIYVVSPTMFFCGGEEARNIELSKYQREMKRQSDARRPELKAVSA